MKKGFTLLEVLFAVAVLGFSFGAFLLLAGRSLDTSDELLKTTLASVLANNLLNEVLYGGKEVPGSRVELLNCEFTASQDFEEVMGFRVVKVEVGTEEKGNLVEVYEAR